MTNYFAVFPNQLIIEVIYTAIILIVTLFIYIKTKDLYKLSEHKGIHYFGIAFLFFAIAFSARFFLAFLSLSQIPTGPFGMPIVLFVMCYAFSMSGFYLVYSLIWKHAQKMLGISEQQHSLFIIALHVVGIIIGLLSGIFQNEVFMFVPQIIIFGLGSLMSYRNYAVHKPAKSAFLQLYFMTMILALVGFGANYASNYIIPIFPLFQLFSYGITVLVFVLFLYGVVKVTKQSW